MVQVLAYKLVATSNNKPVLYIAKEYHIMGTITVEGCIIIEIHKTVIATHRA